MKPLDTDQARETINRIQPSCFDCMDLSSQYLTSYKTLLGISNELVKKYPEDAVLVISHIAYGWMPTILKKFSYEDNPDACESICKAVDVKRPEDGLCVIKFLPDASPINNSWVGLSKVLHFINPNIFPIWDSRVARNFGIYSSSGPNRKKHYIEYYSFVHREKCISIVDGFLEFLERKGHKVTRVRALELLLFHAANM